MTGTLFTALRSALAERYRVERELGQGLPTYDEIRGSARFAAVIRAFGADPAPFVRSAGARP